MQNDISIYDLESQWISRVLLAYRHDSKTYEIPTITCITHDFPGSNFELILARNLGDVSCGFVCLLFGILIYRYYSFHSLDKNGVSLTNNGGMIKQLKKTGIRI